MWILIESEIWIGVKADILFPFTLFARKSIKQSIFQQRFSLFFCIFLLFFFLLAYKISFTSCNPIDWWNIKWAPLFGSLHCYLSSTQVPPCKRVCVWKYVRMSLRLPLASVHSCAHINWLLFLYSTHFWEEHLSTYCEYEYSTVTLWVVSACCGESQWMRNYEFMSTHTSCKGNFSGNPLWSSNVEASLWWTAVAQSPWGSQGYVKWKSR